MLRPLSRWKHSSRFIALSIGKTELMQHGWIISLVVVAPLSAAVGLWAARAVDVDPIPSTREPEPRHAASTSVPASPRYKEAHLNEASTYSEIGERPLFSPTRRPASAPIAATPVAPTATSTPPSYQLLGVLLRPEHRRALIASSSDPGGRWVDEGSSIDGARLQRVGADRIMLGVEDTIIEVRLEHR